MKDIHVVETITEAHRLLGVKKPTHPLISVVHQKDISPLINDPEIKLRVDLYQIWMKDAVECQIGYGRNSYDFSEGTLAFMKPGQVLSPESEPPSHTTEGRLLIFHPDLIRKSPLGASIHNYSFFDYEVHEALHISDEERSTLFGLIDKLEHEISLNIDQHSQHIIVSNLELLLAYCTRYYDRQFYTRTNLHQDHVSRFENLLKAYYQGGKQLTDGVPTVTWCGKQLSMSSNYLSDLLRKETGKNAQEHIHDFVINRAKDRLLGTTDPLSQIAYDLGFEYPQHFSKIFKKKTGISPSEYRQLN